MHILWLWTLWFKFVTCIQYVVVDYLWYRRKVPGAYVDSLGYDVIDTWGRMMPDPKRWPSSAQGKGFSEVANKVHEMGLKFGIHIMRGISTQAVNANTPILDITTVCVCACVFLLQSLLLTFPIYIKNYGLIRLHLLCMKSKGKYAFILLLGTCLCRGWSSVASKRHRTQGEGLCLDDAWFHECRH